MYERFTAWVEEQTGRASPPLTAFTADAVNGYLDYLELERSAATIRKERAALMRLAKHLHQTGVASTSDVLLVKSRVAPLENDVAALDELSWARVEGLALSRLSSDPPTRASSVPASRDAAIVLVLGNTGLRPDEVRSLRCDGLMNVQGTKHSPDSRAWLQVEGKGARGRVLPLPPTVVAAIAGWRLIRPRELEAEPLLFPRLGRQRMNRSFPDAGGRLSDRALVELVRPIMLAAGVPENLARPHVLRHTYGSLFMRRGGRLRALQALMGHSSLASTGIYASRSGEALEAAVDANAQRRPTPSPRLADLA